MTMAYKPRTPRANASRVRWESDEPAAPAAPLHQAAPSSHHAAPSPRESYFPREATDVTVPGRSKLLGQSRMSELIYGREASNEPAGTDPSPRIGRGRSDLQGARAVRHYDPQATIGEQRWGRGRSDLAGAGAAVNTRSGDASEALNFCAPLSRARTIPSRDGRRPGRGLAANGDADHNPRYDPRAPPGSPRLGARRPPSRATTPRTPTPSRSRAEAMAELASPRGATWPPAFPPRGLDVGPEAVDLPVADIRVDLNMCAEIAPRSRRVRCACRFACILTGALLTTRSRLSARRTADRAYKQVLAAAQRGSGEPPAPPRFGRRRNQGVGVVLTDMYGSKM